MAGRPSGNTFIVPRDQILDVDTIREETIVLVDLYLTNVSDCIKWLAKRHLLHNEMFCHACKIPMSLIRKVSSIDGHEWQCKECRLRQTIRKDSFFFGSHLPLYKVLLIIYGWSREYLQKDIAHEAKLGTTSNHTIVDWFSFCRDICEQYLTDHPSVIGGLNVDGTSKIVEIDEPKIFHKKDRLEQWWREEPWLFGGIERGSMNCFLVELEYRQKETLEEVIRKYILPGTIIMSDGWEGFNNISQIDGGIYEHRPMIYEENVEDPVDLDINTKCIENMWIRIRSKRKIRQQFGTSDAVSMFYLNEFIWRSRFGRDNKTFGNFMICLREQYPL